MNDKAQRRYDIVVAGGGMIGSSLALALAPLGLRIAVVEAVARSGSAQPSFDDRSTALSRSTQKMFEAMGLWPEIVAGSTPIRRIHVSDRGRFGFSHIDAAEQGVEALGYVVINRVLGAVLQSAMRDMRELDVLCPATIRDVDIDDTYANVHVEHGETSSERAFERLSCRLLVAADGAASTVRAMMGISAQRSDYGQRAIVGNLMPERSIDHQAYERFTERGPIALLPVADNRAAFVWIVSESDAQALLALDDEAFIAAMQEEFGFRLGRFSKIGKRAAYPLALSKAARLTVPRGVVVGNSAHGLHPVAAQGFNLGMRDVAALCDCIADLAADMAGDPAFDPGDPAVLSRYTQWRRVDQARLVGITDGLVRLFGSRRAPARILRNAGMLGFDIVPGVRTLFARQMMGLSGRLPRLSRGVPIR